MNLCNNQITVGVGNGLEVGEEDWWAGSLLRDIIPRFWVSN